MTEREPIPPEPTTIGEAVHRLRSLPVLHGHPPVVPGDALLLADMMPFSGTKTGHYRGEHDILTVAAPAEPNGPIVVALMDRRLFDPESDRFTLPVSLHRFTRQDKDVLVDETTVMIERNRSDYARPEFALTCRALAQLQTRETRTFRYYEGLGVGQILPLTSHVLSTASRLRPTDRYLSLDASQADIAEGEKAATRLRGVVAALMGERAHMPGLNLSTKWVSDEFSLAALGLGVPLRKAANRLLAPMLDPSGHHEPIADEFPDQDFAIIVDRPDDPHVVLLQGTPAIGSQLSFRAEDKQEMTTSPADLQFLYDARLAGRIHPLPDNDLNAYAKELQAND